MASASGQVGNIAAAMFLYSLIAALGVVGLWFAAYSAHIFLAVLEQTAAGGDEVTWPDEPYVDWLWKGAYFWGLALFWPVVLWWLLRHLPTPPGPMPRLILWGLVIGLLFPVSLLSSLSATSLLVVFRQEIVHRLSRRRDAAGAFLLASLGIPLGILFANYGILLGRDSIAAERQATVVFVGVPIVSGLSAVLFLVYARMVGRLGWILRPHRVPKQRKKLRGIPLPSPDVRVAEKPAVLPSPEFEDNPEAETYGVLFETTPAPVALPQPGPTVDEEESDEAVERLPEKPWTELLQPSVFLFPLHENNHATLMWLTLGWLVVLSLALGILSQINTRFALPEETSAVVSSVQPASVGR